MEAVADLVAIVGLGYVGLPLAAAFAEAGVCVIGYDVNEDRLNELKRGYDRNDEVPSSEIHNERIRYTSDVEDLATASFFIVTVPTPVDRECRPDLASLQLASEIVGSVLKRGDVVVYESTVYPGATEEKCVPRLEAISGLVCGIDFGVGYSPERINPGDARHRLRDVCKVVSGDSSGTLEIVAKFYSRIVGEKMFSAPNIKTAEAAKLIESAQRDLNIALMNAVSPAFRAAGIDTLDVIAAASSKWNFQTYVPGLVGGHCIAVDPYYLIEFSERAHCSSELFSLARRINDDFSHDLVDVCTEAIGRVAKDNVDCPKVVTVCGYSFKENVRDCRNTKVADIVNALMARGFLVQLYDPIVCDSDLSLEGVLPTRSVEGLLPASAVIIAVAHREFVAAGWSFVSSLLWPNGGVVLDLKGVLSRSERPDNVLLWRP